MDRSETGIGEWKVKVKVTIKCGIHVYVRIYIYILTFKEENGYLFRKPTYKKLRGRRMFIQNSYLLILSRSISDHHLRCGVGG